MPYGKRASEYPGKTCTHDYGFGPCGAQAYYPDQGDWLCEGCADDCYNLKTPELDEVADCFKMLIGFALLTYILGTILH